MKLEETRAALSAHRQELTEADYFRLVDYIDEIENCKSNGMTIREIRENLISIVDEEIDDISVTVCREAAEQHFDDGSLLQYFCKQSFRRGYNEAIDAVSNKLSGKH